MSDINTCVRLSQDSTTKFPFSDSEGLRDDKNSLEHVYVTGRDPNSSDMKELERSAIVNIERNPDTYICIHNILQVMNRRMDLKPNSFKWKPYNDNKFLITFDTILLRDTFVSTSSTVYHGSTAITFKPFELNEQNTRKPLKFKVWLLIKGLPVQHLCYKSAELVASKFGRLYACDMAKKDTYVGAFNIIIVTNDITKILEKMVYHFEDDGETIIEIEKQYLCPVQDYVAMDFDEREMSFDEVFKALLNANKLTPLSDVN